MNTIRVSQDCSPASSLFSRRALVARVVALQRSRSTTTPPTFQLSALLFRLSCLKTNTRSLYLSTWLPPLPPRPSKQFPRESQISSSVSACQLGRAALARTADRRANMLETPSTCAPVDRRSDTVENANFANKGTHLLRDCELNPSAFVFPMHRLLARDAVADNLPSFLSLRIALQARRCPRH